MYRNKLDIWAIQKYPNELYNALKNIKPTDNITSNILFRNLISKLSIAGETINSVIYDCALYSENSDTLIMIKKDCAVDHNNIKQYLDEKNISYNEVVFDEEKRQNYPKRLLEIPEIWYAREDYVLKDALEDTKKNHNSNSCTIYPNLTSNLSLQYSVDNKYYNIDEIKAKGLIVTCDKIVLLLKQNDIRNISTKDAIDVIKKMDFNFSINDSDKPRFLNKKTYVKTLKR